MFTAKSRLHLVSAAASLLAVIGLVAVASARAQDRAPAISDDPVPTVATGAPFDLRDFSSQPTPAAAPQIAESETADDTRLATSEEDDTDDRS